MSSTPLSTNMTAPVDEGLVSIAGSKLADFARGFILSARPVIILHSSSQDKTVQLKLKRGLIRHTLYKNEGQGDQAVKSSLSATMLLLAAANLARKYMQRGFLEI